MVAIWLTSGLSFAHLLLTIMFAVRLYIDLFVRRCSRQYENDPAEIDFFPFSIACDLIIIHTCIQPLILLAHTTLLCIVPYSSSVNGLTKFSKNQFDGAHFQGNSVPRISWSYLLIVINQAISIWMRNLVSMHFSI